LRKYFEPPKLKTMKLTFLFVGLGFFFITSIFPSASINQSEPARIESILCSSYGSEKGTCRGSDNCTACTNCKYCGYCNSGGSCGVCIKRPKKYYQPKPKKEPKYIPSRKKKSNSNRVIPQIENKSKATPDYYNNTYTVTKETSLRASGNSKSKILQRLEVNQKVIVLESPPGYWWKVICNNKVGWVKKHLLQNRARA
jgi:hypothetical protein